MSPTRRARCRAQVQQGLCCQLPAGHYGDHDPWPQLEPSQRCTFRFSSPRQQCVMPAGHRGDHLRRWSAVRDPEPQAIPEVPDVPVSHSATCQWCGHEGAPITEIELVLTAGGERKRCADHDECRARVAAGTTVKGTR